MQYLDKFEKWGYMIVEAGTTRVYALTPPTAATAAAAAP